MKEFKLEIITPYGQVFSGNAISLVARTTVGDTCILASHTDYVGNIDIGTVKVKTAQFEKYASCVGGFISVSSGNARIIATTFEFSDEIDVKRAENAKEKAEKIISNSNDEKQIKLAEYKLKRALNRISVSKKI